MKPFNYFLSLIFMLFAHSASAIPLTASDASGYRGASVFSVLTEPTPVDLFALWVDIEFDANVLDYSGLTDLTSGTLFFTPDPTNAATGMLSAVFSGTAIPDGDKTALLQALFTIRGDAPFGDTLVTFQCHDEQNGFGCLDYPFDPVTAKITVLRSTQIPLPATLWLLGLGMTALAGMRLRQ